MYKYLSFVRKLTTLRTMRLALCRYVRACVLLTTIFNCATALYEYGSHVKGEVVSYNTTGQIPFFQPVYHLNITHGRTGFKKEYTLISVDYDFEHVSPLNIIFDLNKMTLSFYVRIPLKAIPFKIVGYSMPLK